MSGYTKLVPEIVQSSIWNESSDVRVVWITLLAIKDADGYVRGDARTVARMANVSVDSAEEALKKFQDPDPFSHTPDNEGRRVAPADGGWMVLNHEQYREVGMSDANKEYWRKKKKEQRERDKSKEKKDVKDTSLTVQDSSASASSSVSGSISVSKDGESEGKKPKRKKALSETDKRRIRVDELTPMMIRIGSWFGRRESTKWTTYEKEALDSIKPDITEVNTLEIYYDFDHPFDCDYRRRKLEQLLNNWASEIDKATKFISDKNREEEGDNNGW